MNKSPFRVTTIFGCLSLLCLVQATASAQTTHNVTSVADSYITVHPSLGGAGSTHGGDALLYEIGPGGFYSYPLIRFDLSQYAGNSVVGPASLTLHVPGTWNNVTVSQSIEVYRVLVPWTESTVTWNNFGPGPICNKNVTCTSLDTVSVTVSPGSTVTFSNLPASLLQGWIDNPSSNHGLLLFSTTGVDDEDIAFASRESKVATGPQLKFSTVPKPCTLSDTVTYSATTSTLTMKFTVGNNLGTAHWSAWLTYADPQGADVDTMQNLFSVSQPVTNPPKAVTKTVTALPKEGVIGVLSTISTTANGIACSSWVEVNSGADPN